MRMVIVFMNFKMFSEFGNVFGEDGNLNIGGICVFRMGCVFFNDFFFFGSIYFSRFFFVCCVVFLMFLL